MKKHFDLLVFCHLRWQFVYQRPQHLISRISKKYKVLFVEEPIGYEEKDVNTANIIQVDDNITVLQPRVKNIDDIYLVLQNYISSLSAEIGWFYSAAFVPVLNHIQFKTIVYDCMDELTLFKGADPLLIKHEEMLISKADIIFTGGKSLYEAKEHRHNNVFCFPSSVDREHFAKATNGIAIASDLPKSELIIGYYGVLDERIDYDLIADVAKKLPWASFVFVGPFAKVHYNDVPKADNIFYMGIKSYEELPNYLKAFDIAIMPFALNEATKFISPTKTLEYMAAKKPIISTPIKDVVRDYKDCVSIVDNSADFVSAVNKIYDQEDGAKEKRETDFNEILEKTSWDKTAESMCQIIHQNLKSK